MSGPFFSKGFFPHELLRPAADYILRTQQADGCIPWFDGSFADPWDHIEAAMGLSIAGEYTAAERAYQWLKKEQLSDGSWWVHYQDGAVKNDERRETNFVAYIATGVWHHYLITENYSFLCEMAETVERAIRFVIGLQTDHGDIHWAVDKQGKPLRDALVTGCSSIYKSLECAINIFTVLGEPKAHWHKTRDKLGHALRHKPERFDRTWESKQRYSMDWFYPVLTGAVDNRKQALARINARWDEFVQPGMGCRCVSDQPWVTVAESCELTMALLAAGDHARAVELYSWLHQWRDDEGVYWTGYQFAEDLLWPDEKPTWTCGAILLAADALTHHTAASKLFVEIKLLENAEQFEQMQLAHRKKD
jgi:hypothetical protein